MAYWNNSLTNASSTWIRGFNYTYKYFCCLSEPEQRACKDEERCGEHSYQNLLF